MLNTTASFTPQRQQIVDVCRYMTDKGYFAATGGNIAVRLDDTRFAITPSATDYYTMKAEDIAILRLDTLEQLEGTKPPSVERGIHAAMLRQHPARLASVHTHQPIASAVALLRCRLPWPPGTDLQRFGTMIELIPYRPSGTKMLAKVSAKALRPDVYAYLMASHGVICSGVTLADGVDMIGRIEAAAAHFLKQRVKLGPGIDNDVRRLIESSLNTAIKEAGEK
ncbi:class II aldolase/adducin family protein [Rhizobium sp. PAMB 3182]